MELDDVGLDDAVRAAQAKRDEQRAAQKWIKRYGLLPNYDASPLGQNYGTLHPLPDEVLEYTAQFFSRARRLEVGYVLDHPNGTRQLLKVKHTSGIRGLLTQHARRRDGQRTRYVMLPSGRTFFSVFLLADAKHYTGHLPDLGSLRAAMAAHLTK